MKNENGKMGTSGWVKIVSTLVVILLLGSFKFTELISNQSQAEDTRLETKMEKMEDELGAQITAVDVKVNVIDKRLSNMQTEQRMFMKYMAPNLKFKEPGN